MIEENWMKKAMPSRKKSLAWTYFLPTGNPNQFKCSLCQRVCSISCGSSGNLMRHLRMRHPKVLTTEVVNESIYANNDKSHELSTSVNDSHNETVHAVLGIDGTTSTDVAGSSHEPVATHPQHMQYFLLEPVDENKTKEINTQILKIIVKEFHPFTIVDNPEFRKLVFLLNSTYSLPSHKDLKNNLLPQVYQATVEELKSTLMEIAAVALTTDKWVSINNERYMTVTAHYLDKNFELKSSFLGCTSFPEKHSSNDIAVFLQSVTDDWHLSDKVVAVVTDNVPSMLSAVRECKWQHVSCFAGVLNKIVNAGLVEIKLVIQKIRHIIGYFKRNTTALETLMEVQNQKGSPVLKMKTDIPARWNTTFEMIARFSKNREALQTAVKHLQLNVQLSSSDWIVIEKAVRLLIIFNSITVEISAENTLSFSKVPHMVRFMMKHVSSTLAQNNLPSEIVRMATKFKEELESYFKELESNAIIGQSVLLDPRFKKRGFPENSYSQAYTALCSQVISLKTEMMNEKNALNESEMRENAVESEYFIDIWCEFKEKEQKHQNDVNEAAIAEIGTFINDEYLPLSDSPITYWGNTLNQNKFPTLFQLVKGRLCVPATAIPGQRIFTKQGNAFLEKRKCLTSGKIKEILFLSHNL